jgi:hypothetical protein
LPAGFLILKSPQSVLTSTRKVNGRPRITYSAGAGKENTNTKKFHTKKTIRKDVSNNNNNNTSNKDNSNNNGNNNNNKDRVLAIGEIVEKDKNDKRKKKKKDNNIVLTNNIKDQNKVDLSNAISININPNNKEISSDNNDDSDSDNDKNNNKGSSNNKNNNNNSNNNNNNKKRSESGKKMKNYTAPKSTTNSRARRSDLRKLNSESNSVAQGTGQVTSVQPPTL